MRHPHSCPVCNEALVETTLQEFVVIAKVKGEEREVHGLAAFSCVNGHIFLLRRADLVDDITGRLAKPA